MAEGKYISYLRVSTDKQGKSGLGIEAQREAVTRYLNGGKWTVIAEYVETESGRRSNRPKLAAALAHAKAIGAKLVFAELDVSVANTFERIASEVLLRSFIPTAEMSMSGQRLADFLQLEEFGLIADHRAQLERRIRVPVARFVLPYYDHGVCLHSDASTKSPIEFKIRGIALTQVGREIYQILSPAFDVENAKTLTEQIPRERLSEISYGQYVHKADGVITYFQTQSLWKAKD